MAWLIALGVAAVLMVAFVRWVRGVPATPEEIARFDASVDEFLATHHDAIEATRRPVLLIDLEPMAADELRASKVGGAPWWPAGMPLPMNDQGKTLVLLAQIDLAGLPAAGLKLPDQGLLQFFVAPNWNYGQDYSRDQSPEALAARRGHRVVYHPDATGPAQTVPAATKKQLPLDVAPPLRMNFTASSETMNRNDDRFESIFPGGFEAATEAQDLDSEDVSEILWDRFPADRHKLGGYPHFTQDNPRFRTDLELLFQLVSNEGVMWGDAGVGNFFITDADLAKRDFSRVFYSWDCC